MEVGLVQIHLNCWELPLSPAGSESPRRGRCGTTEGFSTSLFSRTRRQSRHLAESRTDIPQHGWVAPSHLMEKEQIHVGEEGVAWSDTLLSVWFVSKRVCEEVPSTSDASGSLVRPKTSILVFNKERKVNPPVNHTGEEEISTVTPSASVFFTF